MSVLLSAGDQVEANADRSFDVRSECPRDMTTRQFPPIAEADGLASFFEYSQLDRTRLGNPEAPSFLVTYSQTQLLLAEAISAGLGLEMHTDAYARGIEANMQQYCGLVLVIQASIKLTLMPI
jgi:hypothetical protein